MTSENLSSVLHSCRHSSDESVGQNIQFYCIYSYLPPAINFLGWTINMHLNHRHRHHHRPPFKPPWPCALSLTIGSMARLRIHEILDIHSLHPDGGLSEFAGNAYPLLSVLFFDQPLLWHGMSMNALCDCHVQSIFHVCWKPCWVAQSSACTLWYIFLCHRLSLDSDPSSGYCVCLQPSLHCLELLLTPLCRLLFAFDVEQPRITCTQYALHPPLLHLDCFWSLSVGHHLLSNWPSPASPQWTPLACSILLEAKWPFLSLITLSHILLSLIVYRTTLSPISTSSLP